MTTQTKKKTQYMLMLINKINKNIINLTQHPQQTRDLLISICYTICNYCIYNASRTIFLIKLGLS